MSENPEIKARVLEWQKKYNILDGDPAMALLELLDIYGIGERVVVRERIETAPSVSDEPTPAPAVTPTERLQAVAATLDDAAIEQLRGHLMPALERLSFQTQELKQRLDDLSLETFAQQIASYHEGIDYCTKKLDVVKKESDAVTQQITKVAGSIQPITRVAVLVLMLVAGLIGFVIAVAVR